jgi:hypothetical protein
LFHFGWAVISNLAKAFAQNTRVVVDRMQIVSTESFKVELVSHGFTQRHSDRNRVFLPVAHRGGPKSLPECIGNPP